ncbi:unnamed protein product [Heligmosomoides polygyrus]|uniref:WAPL domain-containing protein n=1 Tax=Heligmosomoides polygyrus TaxID=6339 RepID=A0A183FYV0_HELPZ|nr:unnamed protein product [Heligmosomoides polygyrus]
MFSKEDAQKEAGNRAFNGLPQLAKLIRGVLEKTISKVGERDAAVRDIATIVSNCMLLYADGCESDIYPLGVLVTDLCSLALLETKENSEKLTKKRVAYKTTCFELAINVLNKLCERQMLCDNNQFLRFVFDVLQEPMLKFQPWMEDDVSSVLAKFVAFSTTLITHAHLKKDISRMSRNEHSVSEDV